MKKRLVVALALLATVVGMVFAYSKTVITYYKCGKHIKSSSPVTTSYYNEDGKTEYKTSSTECPTCKAEKLLAEEQRKRENACNVLKGASPDRYNATRDSGDCD